MRKAPEAFRTISEAAELLETPAHVLRFWESRFPQIKPVKRAGGRRYYRPVDIDLLSGIKLLLHDQGMTIRGVQKLLQEKGPRHVSELAPLGDSITGDVIEADFKQAAYEVLPDDLAELDLPAPVATETDAKVSEDVQQMESLPAIAEPAPPELVSARVSAPPSVLRVPVEGPPNAFANLGAAPVPERPVQRVAVPVAADASRLARQLRLGVTLTDPARAATLTARLQVLADRLSAADARDRARL